MKHLHEDDKNSAFKKALHALASRGFCGCCWGPPGVVPLILPRAQCVLGLQVHASFGVKSLFMGMQRCCKTLLWTPPILEGSQHVASPGMPELSAPRKTQPPLCQHQLWLGAHCISSRDSTFLPSWHVSCLLSCSWLHAEVLLPQLPVEAVVAADRLPVPLSSCGINASVTECQGDVAVLNVSLPASTFPLTP